MEEQRRLRLDGSVVDIEVLGISIQWQGTPAALSVLRDITRRVRDRRALLESERRLAALAENIPGATYQCVLRPNGRLEFSYVSQGVQDLFGVDAEQVMARATTLLKSCIRMTGVRCASRFVIWIRNWRRLNWNFGSPASTQPRDGFKASRGPTNATAVKSSGKVYSSMSPKSMRISLPSMKPKRRRNSRTG